MKRMRNILSWLGAEEEEAVLKDAELHVEESCMTVSFLAAAIRAHIADDLSGVIAAIEQIKSSERRADQLRAKMITELSGNILMPPDREDLMRFASALDKIADSTLRAGRILGLIDARMPEPVLREMAISTELVVKGIENLQKAIQALGRDQVEEALAGCEMVERCEHEADDQKRSLLKAVLHACIDPPHLLLCYNLAEALEVITDRIDLVADMLRLFALRSR